VGRSPTKGLLEIPCGKAIRAAANVTIRVVVEKMKMTGIVRA
jgi:hypothetical protein